MNEEIKEILDYLKRSDKNKFGFEQGKLIDYEETQLLLDYITNLQQDLEKANDIIEKDRQFYKCRMDEYAKLKKENERLKEDNLLIKSSNKLVSDNLHNYKSRCEKAIEYIENNKKETSSHFNGKEYVYRNFTLYCEPNDLLNILNGSDEK